MSGKLTSIQHRRATRDRLKLIRWACRPSSLPRPLRLFMNFNILTLFFPLFSLLSPSSAAHQASGPLPHRARRRALTRRSALLRRLLNISIKFCLSGRPDDLPWRAGGRGRARHGEPWNGYRTQSCISKELAWRWPGHEFNISPLHLSFCRGRAPNSIPEIWNEIGKKRNIFCLLGAVSKIK